jgi:molecular chaperone DnaK
MGRVKIDYGIDLGTTNSALSRMENGEVITREIDGSRIVPSCVYIDRKSRVRAGIQAKNKFPHFFEFKRKMGQDVEFNVSDGTKTNPEKLSADLLKKLASEIADEAFKSVVITVPAAFELPQVSATKRAAELAGFEQVEILQEPVAAAFNYGLKHKVTDGKFVVFDFGGGTFDAALVASTGGVMEVKSSEGDNFLGGGDIDRAVVNEILLPYLRENYSISELESKDEADHDYWFQRLKNIADELKKELGKSEDFEVLTDIGFLPKDDEGEEMELDFTVTRGQLNDLARPLFQRAIDKTKFLLQNNDLSESDLSALVLVGGPTQMPLLRDMVEEQLTKPDISINPMTGIAEGAALYASTMQNNVKTHGSGPDSDSDSDEPIVEIEVDFSSPSNLDKEPVSVVLKGTNEPLFGEILREDGTRTERAALDAVFMVDVDQKKANNFTINVFNEKNDSVACSPDKFTILPGIAVSGGSPLPKFIGMDYRAKNGKVLFHSFQGLEKDKPMPAVGKSTLDLVTKHKLRPGNTEDELVIKIYQAESRAEGSRSIVNSCIGQIEINGAEVPKLVPEGTEVKFTLSIDISQTMALEADFPTLDFEIEKELKFDLRDEVSREQASELLQEADKLVDRLESSDHPPANLSEIKEKRDRIKKTLDQDGPIDQAFNHSRELLLDLDLAEEGVAWPELVGEINEAFKNLEDLVQECISNSLDGHEKDKSDLDYLRTLKDSVLASNKTERGKEFLEKIRELEWKISDRHAGKEKRIAWIRGFDSDFGSIDWTNQAEARRAVDRGMELVNSGASFQQLNQQVQSIVGFMRDRDSNTAPGPTEGGGVGE